MLGSVLEARDYGIEKKKALIPDFVELTFLWGRAQIIRKIKKIYSILDTDKYSSREGEYVVSGVEIWIRKASFRREL